VCQATGPPSDSLGGTVAQLEHHAWSPHQGEHSDFFRNTFKVSHGITTQRAISYEEVVTRPTQRSSEAILSIGEVAPSDVTTRSGREGVKGRKKRHKEHLQGTVTTISHDDGNDGEAGGSGMRHNSVTAHSDKCEARPPTD
jgi:hypothetical protein